MKVRRLTAMALLTAVALIIFTVEAQLPAPIPIPGIKLGLSNIVTVFALWLLGPAEAAMILFARIFLGAVFAGNFSTVFYSLAGGSLAWVVTFLFCRFCKNQPIWIAGCLGAIAHAIGQMAAAILISGTASLIIYLPVMIACAIITGAFTGLCAQLLVKRGNKFWKISFK